MNIMIKKCRNISRHPSKIYNFKTINFMESNSKLNANQTHTEVYLI